MRVAKRCSILFLALLWLSFTMECCSPSAPEAPPAQPECEMPFETGDLVFFSFDDDSIPWRENLKLTLEQPKKYPGNPVLRSGPPGSVDSLRANLYGTVLKIGDKFRMWYVAWTQPDKGYPET